MLMEQLKTLQHSLNGEIKKAEKLSQKNKAQNNKTQNNTTQNNTTVDPYGHPSSAP